MIILLRVEQYSKSSPIRVGQTIVMVGLIPSRRRFYRF